MTRTRYKTVRALGALTLVGLLTGWLQGCAVGPVTPKYVSPTAYQALTCNQLADEADRLSAVIARGVPSQPLWRSLGVGVSLGGVIGGGGRGGWGISPNVIIGQNGTAQNQRAELGHLLGEREALLQAARFKNCHISTPAPFAAS